VYQNSVIRSVRGDDGVVSELLIPPAFQLEGLITSFLLQRLLLLEDHSLHTLNRRQRGQYIGWRTHLRRSSGPIEKPLNRSLVIEFRQFANLSRRATEPCPNQEMSCILKSHRHRQGSISPSEP